MRTKTLEATQFGRLTVIGEAPRSGTGHRRVVVKCECGTEKTVMLGDLKRRKGRRTESCGCLNKEITSRRSVSHGELKGGKRTSEYKAWEGMRSRCGNPDDAAFKHYGGRGISVCSRWAESFEDFLSDIGRKPSPSHSIDRIDVNGNYEPSNCRWATSKTQGNNRRNNHRIVAFGVERTVAEWVRASGVKYTTILQRLNRGLSPEEAVTP